MTKRTKTAPERHSTLGGLKRLAIPTDGLKHDPNSARKHSDENLRSMKASLARYGQHRPIVVQKREGENVVRAGNCLLDAARALKWTHVAALVIEEDDKTALGRAIADNRVGELAEWDDAVLAESLAVLSEDEDLFALGWSEKELAKLLPDPELEESEDWGAERRDDGEPDSPASHVRMVQLFFDEATILEFQEKVAVLMKTYGCETITDAVLEAVRRGHESA